MLWKKVDGVYVDLLKDFKYLNKLCVNNKKNNKLSENARVEGNSKLKANDLDGAIKSYNKSLRFAEDNDHLSLAYANRSYCCLKKSLYKECLADIQLAIESNYPQHLVPKLEKRKQLCIEKLKSPIGIPVHRKIELSYDSDKELPCMANTLKIDFNEIYGRFVSAKNDISIGDTLVVEAAYIRSTTEDDECCNCCMKNINLIPCPECPDVLYCNSKCSGNNMHSVECNLLFGSDGNLINFILRSIIVGIYTFTTIDEMIEFVDSCLSKDNKKEITQSIATPQSTYKTFFNLSSLRNDHQILSFREQAAAVYNTVMDSSNLAVKFETQAKQRFLKHLIFHHGLIIRTNAFGGLCEPTDNVTMDDDKSQVQNEINSDYERNIFLVSSYFNHSCLPNVTKLSKGKLAVVKAIQPIKKGQQLFVTYLAGDLIKRSTEDRKSELENGYGFRCSCDLCVFGRQTDFLILEMDSDFQYVANNIRYFKDFMPQIREHCINFLLKYPDKICSEPGYYILTTLVAIFQKELVEH